MLKGHAGQFIPLQVSQQWRIQDIADRGAPTPEFRTKTYYYHPVNFSLMLSQNSLVSFT